MKFWNSDDSITYTPFLSYTKQRASVKIKKRYHVPLHCFKGREINQS